MDVNFVKSIVFSGVIFIFSNFVYADEIHWYYKGTLSAKTIDSLGIDGEVVELHLVFNPDDVWVQGPDYFGNETLFFPTIAASATITGPHTIAPYTASPAARYMPTGGGGGMTQAMYVVDYVDFTIDGLTTITFAGNGPLLDSPPVAGDNLVSEHLRNDISVITMLKDPVSDVFYEYIDRSVTITRVVNNLCEGVPFSYVTTSGGGQSPSVNSEVQVTFLGQFTSTDGLINGSKNQVKICPGSLLEYNAMGAQFCTVNGTIAATTGNLVAGDKLTCTSKPGGSDTDSFIVRTGR